MARNRKRAAKKDPWVEEDLLFGAKSKLIDVDLEKYFADPQAWAVLDESEKAQLRALLPSHIALNEDGSIPQDFLKYDADWRNALRQFKVDLEAGRYDADWLEEAAQAMEERAAGEFDDFKEKEYEEFWGQKQKLSHDVVAGDLTTLKLEVLVKAGVYKVGDVWSFSRTIGRGKKGVVVEKDVPIITIDDGKLTFAIPPGQSKYLVKNEVNGDDATKSVESLSYSPEVNEVPVDIPSDSIERANLEAGQSELVDKVNHDEISGRISERDLDQSGKGDPMDLDAGETKSEGKDAISGAAQYYSNDNNNDKHVESTEPVTPQTVEGALRTALPSGKRVTRSQNIVHGSSMTPKTADRPRLAPVRKAANGLTKPKTPPKSEDPNQIILTTITHPAALEAKILEVDGRIQNSGKYNAWKAIRCNRDNQDMGSLWEMREEYYVHRLSR